MFPAAIAMACREDAQYLLTVVALVFFRPASKVATRAILYPCSPPGKPQPMIMSSMESGSK